MNRPHLASRLTLAALAALAGVACDSKRSAPPAPSSPAASEPTPLVAAPREGIRWEQAPAGLVDAAPAIKTALAVANAEGRTLLVYVGATWCEPCQRFHHAVEQGALDAAFPHLSFLAFDADRDAEPLATAGYFSRLIPLFAVPKSDGHSSGKQIEGSVKGEAAVGEITPRLRGLISGS